MKFPPSRMALEWLGPPKKGVEIGASAENDFGVDAVNVAPDDPQDCAFYDQVSIDRGEAPARVDIRAEGDDLPLPDSSTDFILSSHVIEHMPNPLRALAEWHRVLKPGGICYTVVPHRDALPADVGRPLSTLDQLIRARREKWTVNTAPTEGVPGGRRGHYWVWDEGLFLSMVEWLHESEGLLFALEHVEPKDDKVGNSFVVILRAVKQVQV